jgi:membrane-associated protein
VEKAEDYARRWGALGIFFSRWLITPLGPWISITSGISGYPWGKFFVIDLVGEFLWVLIYVLLGMIFSEQVQFVSDMVGNFTWMLVGLTAVAIVAWMLLKGRNQEDTAEA